MNFFSELWNQFAAKDIRFQFVFSFSVGLFLLSVVLFIIVLRLRRKKTMAAKKAKALLEEIEPLILALVYEVENDDPEWNRQLAYLRNELNVSMYDFHSYARVSDYLIELHQQLEGESAEKIERIYKDLQLPQMTLKLLKEGPWHQKVKALGALSEFRIRQYLFEVVQYIDHKQRLVRDEAQFAAIVLGGRRALSSIGELTSPISKWQQLRLMDQCAKLGDTVKPNILDWMGSQNESLTELTLRIAIKMGWFEIMLNVPNLIGHKNTEIRRLCVQAVSELGDAQMISNLLHRYEVESKTVQIEIIEAIGDLDIEGAYQKFLVSQLIFGDFDIGLAAAKALEAANNEDFMTQLKSDVPESRHVIIDQVVYGAA
ncbi:MAG: hypothetical protein HWE14_08965 [Flavobacteriia bacterium]|nr:hypothetical protein [Flavobacteriia bacterium]